MAAAIIPFIPIIAGLAPELVTLIAKLVHKQAPIAEAANGPGTGAAKFGDVFVAVMKTLTNAKVAGQISALPDDNSVKVIMQSVVTAMKLSGTLGEDAPSTAVISPTAVSSPGLVLRAGQTITITLAA